MALVGLCGISEMNYIQVDVAAVTLVDGDKVRGNLLGKRNILPESGERGNVARRITV